MKNLSALLVFSFLLSLTASVVADEIPPALRANGCGTAGIQGVLVPDSTILSRCKFENACNKHDICYGKCLDGGELYGEETCNDPIAKEARRSACDTNFFNDIVKDNNDRPICKFYGKIYRLAVVKLGKGNFNGREIENLAQNAFDKGETEAENFYQNLSQIQSSAFTPQSMSFNKKTKVLTIKQSDSVLKFDQNLIDEMANKSIQRTQ